MPKSLPFCFRQSSQTPGAGLPVEPRAPGPESPPQAQPYHPFTPQMQKVRQPTVEEVAVRRSRLKTTGDIPSMWQDPSSPSPTAPVSTPSSPFTSASTEQQLPPTISNATPQTPQRTRRATSPPTTPPRRYTPQVTDFALPRNRRYRLSLKWKPRPTEEEDPKARGSPVQTGFPTSPRVSTWLSPGPGHPTLPARRKLIYSLDDLPEHPRQGRRYTDGIVGNKTESTGELVQG